MTAEANPRHAPRYVVDKVLDARAVHHDRATPITTMDAVLVLAISIAPHGDELAFGCEATMISAGHTSGYSLAEVSPSLGDMAEGAGSPPGPAPFLMG